MSFTDLGLSPKVLEAVTAAGYTTATPIQLAAIPAALARRDVMGLAQTGSGKTAAFVLPMLTLLERGRARARMPRTLILEPTRELAAQVHDAFETLGKQHKLTVSLLIGGVSFDEQALKIDRGADVVIATPGRLLDHFERGKLLLTGIELLVIDEADRMLDMGFIPDIERICKLLPFTRQTLFFSATMPPEIQRLTTQFLHNPERIEVSPPSSTAATIEQWALKVPSEATARRDALRALLRQQSSVKNGIIFANRKTTVALLEKSLQKHGFSAAALHGDMDQSARLRTLASFKNNEVTYLVASDVAARGLDIPDVSHVFNFDVPVHAEDYVHRIGRTGRAGRSGHAFMLVSTAEMKTFHAIEALIQKPIPWANGQAPVAGETDEEAPRPASRGRGRRGPAEKTDGEKRAPRTPVKKATAPVAASPLVESEPAVSQSRKSADPVVPAPTSDRTLAPARMGEKPRRSQDVKVKSLPDEGEGVRGFHEGNMPAFLTRPVRVPT